MIRKLQKRGGTAVIMVLILLLIWELAVVWTDTPAWLLPAPTAIYAEAAVSMSSMTGHLLATIKLTLTGFMLGTIVGICLAVLLHLWPRVNEALYPLLILSQNVPVIVLAPLLVIWFGFGTLPKLIVITLVCFFPVVIAALDGFRQTSPELKHYMLMAGATKRQLFYKLEWPHALPSLFSGLKISATYSVMGAVISEWLGAKEGIGVYMTLASSSFRTDRVFLAIFSIMLLSLIFFGVIMLIERLLVKGQRKDGEVLDEA